MKNKKIIVNFALLLAFLVIPAISPVMAEEQKIPRTPIIRPDIKTYDQKVNVMRDDEKKSEVNSFKECEDAGFPVMESTPRQCKTYDGRLFVEGRPNIDTKINIDVKAKIDPNLKNDDKEPRKIKDIDYSAVKADIVNNNGVGSADLRKLMSQWGKCSETEKNCSGDLNSDGLVNYEDIKIMINLWTESDTKEHIKKCLTLDEKDRRVCFWTFGQDRAEDVQMKKDTIKADLQKTRPNIKTNPETEKKIDSYLLHINNAFTHMTSTIVNLENVITKLESRIKIIEEERGEELTNARQMLEEAKIKLNASTSESIKISADSEKVILDGKTEFFAKIRIMVDNIKDVHQTLEKVVSEIKLIQSKNVVK